MFVRSRRAPADPLPVASRDVCGRRHRRDRALAVVTLLRPARPARRRRTVRLISGVAAALLPIAGFGVVHLRGPDQMDGAAMALSLGGASGGKLRRRWERVDHLVTAAGPAVDGVGRPELRARCRGRGCAGTRRRRGGRRRRGCDDRSLSRRRPTWGCARSDPVGHAAGGCDSSARTSEAVGRAVKPKPVRRAEPVKPKPVEAGRAGEPASR